MNLEKIFQVPIYTKQLDLDNKSIFSYCKKIQKEDKGIVKSNLGGWHSKDLEGTHTKLNELFEDIEHYSNIFGKECGFKNNVIIKNIWININKNNNSNQTHFHPNSYFSGVYYVQFPKNGGDLVFSHPAEDLMCHNWPDKNKENMTFFNSEKHHLYPKDGLLVIFPSWLKHGVYANNSVKERVSISFNLT